MAQYKPDVTIHLVADFETSQARKPGDIDRIGFERRVALMEETRMRDPRIKTVDAGLSRDEVTAALFGHVWNALLLRSSVPAASEFEASKGIRDSTTQVQIARS